MDVTDRPAPPDSPSPLEPSPETRAAWLQAFSAFAHAEIDRLASQPAHGIDGPAGLAIAQRLSQPIPEQPLAGGPEQIIAILREAVSASYVTPGPRYLAYVPGGGITTTALADYLISCLNRFTGLAAEAPALCRLEADVLDWLLAAFGWGDLPEARGLLLSGGSAANFSAVVCARHAHFGDTGDLRQAVAYASSQTHHSVRKAMQLAGIPSSNLRTLPVTEDWRLQAAQLAPAIAADRARGRVPFLVVSSAGTTNTGAVDPLAEISAVCRAEGLWHHVDAAYGGGFVLCPEGARMLAGIDQADSITMDPHKSLFLPFGTGCLLVREGQALRAAHQVGADYLAAEIPGEPPSPAHYGLQLTRRWQGLRLWLPLMLHGAGAFRDALSEKLALARHFSTRLCEEIDRGLPVEVVATPQLSITAFRLRRRSGETLAALDARNQGWLETINARGEVFLSATRLPLAKGSALTLRVCVLSVRTHRQHVDRCIAELVQTARTHAI